MKKGVLPPESGAATVLDVHTGEVKLMVSVSGFDPNLFKSSFGSGLAAIE